MLELVLGRWLNERTTIAADLGLHRNLIRNTNDTNDEWQ